ncbi:MAG TPA: sel1 repeat family protein [Rhodanobacteraceae bacterium]|nr:sel1 repeat family protein [Rhodanobacteraceae bacterium]
MKSMLLASLVFGIAALGASPVALAQLQLLNRGTMAAPDYGSGASAGVLSNPFNTPESDGRPGVKAYKEGMRAFNRDDYKHAVHMLKVAASWGYKPAEYNLGVMYFQGEGVPVDRPLGAAWLVLAAERGNPNYTAARDVVITWLNAAEFARTDELWGQLKQTYGDEVALRRAKAQWALARSQKTGSRVGGTVGELRVGIAAGHGAFKTAMTNNRGQSAKTVSFASSSWMNLLTGGSTDGDIAYKQFTQSDDPYDPIFLKGHTGTVSVEPLQSVEPATDKTKKHGNDTDGAAQPTPPPRSA